MSTLTFYVIHTLRCTTNKRKTLNKYKNGLGHSQIQTTMNLYLHPSDEEIRENWEKVQHAFDITKKS
ncbi:hypothetical protein EDD69_1302 [Thermolongibacillus altinsuensis]|uniref:Phage integrase family protein n=1 Tax=Thermolongibacillus altinsuensis TaxID=575256 RepID=A0A4R1QE09_9BACL|nr:hypothetical protein EDD69_1302 [Thermolongibacillus altinsuensis]